MENTRADTIYAFTAYLSFAQMHIVQFFILSQCSSRLENKFTQIVIIILPELTFKNLLQKERKWRNVQDYDLDSRKAWAMICLHLFQGGKIPLMKPAFGGNYFSFFVESFESYIQDIKMNISHRWLAAEHSLFPTIRRQLFHLLSRPTSFQHNSTTVWKPHPVEFHTFSNWNA